MPKYNPEKDIPDLSGKVILITGGTSGLGAETLKALAAHNPSHIYFTGRSQPRASSLLSTLQTTHPAVALTFLETDHASLASVRSSAHTFLSAATRLDLLILNAGIMAVPPALTPDGYEVQFGVNHLSHALLVKLLLPTLRSTAQQPGSDVRVVAVASLAFSGHPSGGIRFDTLQTPQAWWLGGAWQRYGQAKLANILYAAELARRHPYAESKITFLSIHPGTFNTHLITSLGVVNRAMIWTTNAGDVRNEKRDGEGGWHACWAATSPREGIENGAFYVPIGVKGRKFRENGNADLAGRLWGWTEGQLQGWGVEE